MRKHWDSYSLSYLLWGQFLVSLLLYFWGSYHHWVETGREGSLGWLWLGEVMENWQSEALQIAIFVYLTVRHKHKDSPQSRDGDDRVEQKIDMILRSLATGVPAPNLELRERLAMYAHLAWTGWMEYQFRQGEYRWLDSVMPGETRPAKVWVMSPEAMRRWERQMDTAYVDLSEEEKASDRKEADKILAIMMEYAK